MKYILKEWFTDKNGDHEIYYIWITIGLVVFLGLSIANWDKFSPQEWGIGFGSFAAGAGALAFGRSKAGVTQ